MAAPEKGTGNWEYPREGSLSQLDTAAGYRRYRQRLDGNEETDGASVFLRIRYYCRRTTLEAVPVTIDVLFTLAEE